MSNTNLFYSLYSTSNDMISTNYVCSSAVDESATSFDISDDTGTITDSNGNTLSSIDLSSIHEDNITLYNCETRIIQPYSTYLLQGLEYGFAYTTYYYKIPVLVYKLSGYEYYLNMEFDIYYDNPLGRGNHIIINIDTENDITTLLNNEFTTDNIKVSASILSLEDPVTKETEDYLVFTSLANTFFYYLKNLRIKPVFISEDYPNSPFSEYYDDIHTDVYNLLELYHPLLPNTTYNEDTYEVNCDLYEWMTTNFYDIITQRKKFEDALKYLSSITSDSTDTEITVAIDMANSILEDTVYNSDVINAYDDNNMQIIYQIICELKELYLNTLVATEIWLIEDIKRRIPIMKYPNGAFRGIVIVPDYPTTTDDYDYASLWIHHIKDTATILLPVIPKDSSVIDTSIYKNNKDILYRKHEVGVLANATLIDEKTNIPFYNNISNIDANIPFINTKTDGYEDSSTCEIFELPLNNTPEESVIFMGRSYYSNKDSVIGLYRYLQYVSDENLWVKMGDAYMIIGKDDDPLEKTKNLPSSLLIYNPNDIPIRIKYLIFS